MEIRHSAPPDLDGILHTHRDAFGPGEGPVIENLVRDLFEDPSALPVFSYLAHNEEKIIGHILFTCASLEGADSGLSVQLLAPLAILPAYQSKGIGLRLVRHGLEELARAGVDLVFVLGHPGYYPKAGFSPALPHGLAAPYTIEEKNIDAWMVRQLHEGLIGNIQGTIRCADALDQPEYWRE